MPQHQQYSVEVLFMRLFLLFMIVRIFKITAAFNHRSIPLKSFGLNGLKADREVIYYIHGWQRNPRLFERDYEAHQSDPAFVSKMLEKGYVLAELLWHQASHSPEVREVQERIWANDSVVDNLLMQFHRLSLENPGARFRFVGHSLGHQLALRLADRLIQDYPDNPDRWPQRLSLLEPAFVRSLNQSRSDRMLLTRSQCIKLMRQCESKGIALEIYRSSFITRNPFIGYSNQELIKHLPYPSVDINHRWFDWAQMASTHVDIKRFYFKSFTETPNTVCGKPMQSPTTTLAQTFSHYGLHFEQIVHGKHSGKFVRCSKKDIPGKCPFLRFVRTITPPAFKKKSLEALPIKSKALSELKPPPNGKTSTHPQKMEAGTVSLISKPVLLSAPLIKEAELQEITRTSHLRKREDTVHERSSSMTNNKTLIFSTSKPRERIINAQLNNRKN